MTKVPISSVAALRETSIIFAALIAALIAAYALKKIIFSHIVASCIVVAGIDFLINPIFLYWSSKIE
jgi:hypothetical protein